MQMAKIGAVKENRPWTVNFNQNSIRGYNIKDGSGKVVNAVDFGAKYNQEIQSTTMGTSHLRQRHNLPPRVKMFLWGGS